MSKPRFTPKAEMSKGETTLNKNRQEGVGKNLSLYFAWMDEQRE